MVEEKRFERRKDKNESERKRGKRMKGRRERKPAGRQDQDNLASPRLE